MPRWLQVIISPSNIHQILNLMPDSEILRFKLPLEVEFDEKLWEFWRFQKFSSKDRNRLLKPPQKSKMFIKYIKINVKRKWIHPHDSWGPKVSKLVFLLRIEQLWSPYQAKQERWRKLNISSQFQQRVKEMTKCTIFYLGNLHSSLQFSSNSTSRGSFERRIESAFRICHWI